jgi:DNA-binding LytR/AlgR family response regulator
MKTNRLIVKIGNYFNVVKVDDIALIKFEGKRSLLVDHTGNKFSCESNLGDLEKRLDKASFFRANRQTIINVNYLSSYKKHDKTKLQVELNVKEKPVAIIISTERAVDFRSWIKSL